jgi:tripartite-type tricarboxylate transporter receptor subunit TctC
MEFRKTAATLALSLLAAMTCLASVTRADDYPSRTITLVVPFPPGGPSDVVARIIGEGIGRQLNQTVIIENVGGAGGTIGTARVAAATPTATRCWPPAWARTSPRRCSRPASATIRRRISSRSG